MAPNSSPEPDSSVAPALAPTAELPPQSPAPWNDVSTGADAPTAQPGTHSVAPSLIDDGEKSWLQSHWPTLKWLMVVAVAMWATEWVTTRRMLTERPPLRVQSATKTAATGQNSTARTLVAPTAVPKIVVHIVGRVRRPGVYTLPATARGRDLVQASGGALPDADANSVNLAARLNDGEQINLLARSNPNIPTARISSITRPDTPISNRREQKSVAPISPKRTTTAKAVSNVRFPLDINRATIPELETLPGIGPALSARIVEFRTENGAFGSVDDLDEVKGIGEKLLAKMRPFVVVR